MRRFLLKWVPFLLWTAVILSAANDEFSTAQTRGWLEQVLGTVPPFVNSVIRKAGHVVGYGILGLLAWRAQTNILRALLLVMAVAVTDETMQSFTLTREGSPYDVLLDTCGALLALLLVPAVRRAMRPRAMKPRAMSDETSSDER